MRNAKVILYLFLYVHDILMTNSRKIDISNFKEILNDEFEIKDIDEAK